MEERLQKYMARCGVASRRKCEEIILNGEIKVNGILVTEVGTKINPSTIKFFIKIKKLKLKRKKYILCLINQKDI